MKTRPLNGKYLQYYAQKLDEEESDDAKRFINSEGFIEVCFCERF